MALRILPFRQYSDHDVVNLYSVIDSDVNDATTDAGAGDAGLFVKVSAGNFDDDPVSYTDNTYLGKTNYPFVGSQDMYPEVNLKITGSTSGAIPLGITLYQTAKNDENGEKLLYHPQKALELQALLPGQAVPVLTKGIVTLASEAFDGDVSTYTIGRGIKTSQVTNGKITGALRGVGETADVFGHVIGTGVRSNVGITTDQFSGQYIVVSFNCN
jgi:hypothetical protein